MLAGLGWEANTASLPVSCLGSPAPHPGAQKQPSRVGRNGCPEPRERGLSAELRTKWKAPAHDHHPEKKHSGLLEPRGQGFLPGNS